MNGKIRLQKSERKQLQKCLNKSRPQHVHDSLPEHKIAHIRHWTIMVVFTTIISAFFQNLVKYLGEKFGQNSIALTCKWNWSNDENNWP